MNDYNEIYNATAALPSHAAADTAEKPAEVFEKKEQILSFLCMAAGFLFVRFCCYHVTGLLTTVLFCLMITMYMIYLKRSGKAFAKHHKALAGVLYIFSAVYTITANHLLTFLCTVFLIVVSALLVYAVCQTDSNTFRWLPFTMEKALFSHPFGSYQKCASAALSGMREKNGLKNILHIILGLIITIPLTAIVAVLLSRADEGVAKMLNSLIFEPSFDSLILIPHAAFGLLIGFYIFGMLYSNVKTPKCVEDSACEHRILKMRIMPNAMVYAAVTPICILYVLFFVSQFQYFLGGFTGQLSDGYTYAEYARKGFFELCQVCCINFAVIGVMSFLAKHCGKERPLILRIYTLFLSVSSLILAGTAMAKMFLYIRAYGMTQLRIYTTWFMLLLVMGFVLIIIRQFKIQLPVCKIGFILFTAMFGLLCFSRPDAWMTEYNAKMYLSGQLEEFDYNHLHSLSDDALVTAMSYKDVLDTSRIESELKDFDSKCREDFYRYLNLSAWQIIASGGASK